MKFVDAIWRSMANPTVWSVFANAMSFIAVVAIYLGVA